MPLDQIDVGDDYYKGEEPKIGEEVKEMGFLDHLEELRWHIIRSVAVIFVIGIALFLNKEFLFGTIILGPKNPNFLSYQAIYALSDAVGLGRSAIGELPVKFTLEAVDLGEQFLTHIKVSFILGFIVAFPYVFWEVWRFIKPGLYDTERKAVRGIVFICSFLFFLGVSFGYFVVSPFAVNFLAGYQIADVETAPRLSSFVNYMVMFTAPAGLIFELPVVVYFFAKLGLVTGDIMKQYRRHAIIIILMVSAIITPPDIVTQFLIGIPLFFLYEISINIANRVEKKLKKQEALNDKELARQEKANEASKEN